MAMVLVPWIVTIVEGLGIDMMMICMVIMHLEAIPEETEGAWIMVAVLEAIDMVMEWTALVMDVAVIMYVGSYALFEENTLIHFHYLAL